MRRESTCAMLQITLQKRLWLVLLFAGILTLFAFSWSHTGPKDPIRGSRPQLVLILIIDQLRYDYLVRFRPQFVERGFNLLLGGANFVNCR